MDDNTCIRQNADPKQIQQCITSLNSLEENFDYLASGLSLVGNPVRLKIMFLLFQEKRLCVCDVSDILGMTVSAVSQHLRKLKDREMISTEREGQTIYYSLTGKFEEMLNPIFNLLRVDQLLV